MSVVHRIFESLMDDKSGYEEKIKLDFPSQPSDVKLPKKIAKEVIPISMKIGESMKIYGFRFFLNAKTLLKSLALMKNKNIVTKDEFEEFLELTRHLNFDYNPI